MLIVSDLYRWGFEKVRGKGFGLGIFNAFHKLAWEGLLQPESVKVNGCRLHLPKRGQDLADTLRMGRVWEPEVVAEISRLLKPGMTFADVGANIGYYSVLASRLVGPSGRVIAFEPEVENLALLWMNLRDNACANVEVAPYAVGSSLGFADLNLCPESPGGHSLAIKPEGGEGARRVVTVALDEFLDPARGPDAVKIDIEGGESAALEGMRKILKDPRLKFAVIECHPKFLAERFLKQDDVLAPLKRLGFRARALDPLNVLCER